MVYSSWHQNGELCHLVDVWPTGWGRWPPTLSLVLLRGFSQLMREFFLSTVAKVLLIVETVGFLYKKCKGLDLQCKCLEIMYVVIWRYTNWIDVLTHFTHCFPIHHQVIRSEFCAPCGRRTKFGKIYLRCQECRVVTHPECRDRCPLPCNPTSVSTPIFNTEVHVLIALWCVSISKCSIIFMLPTWKLMCSVCSPPWLTLLQSHPQRSQVWLSTALRRLNTEAYMRWGLKSLFTCHHHVNAAILSIKQF